jgi:signal transduction histidine kinase
MSAPLVALALVFRPDPAVLFIMSSAVIGMLMVCAGTGNRRAAARRHAQLEEALTAANQVADESVQAALTTTLLTLGHFLHELRNYQQSIASNLEYIELHAALSHPLQEALAEARESEKKQEDLVRSTIDDLRARAIPTRHPFSLKDALERARNNAKSIVVRVDPGAYDVEIAGNIEHLNIVLLNLIRNSEQAGAQTVTIACRTEPSGHAVQLAVDDDGPGLPTPSRTGLFDTFALSTKPGGSGLGLYLVRRYVELLGGRIEVSIGASGGAAFVIRLPAVVRGKILTEEPRTAHGNAVENF